MTISPAEAERRAVELGRLYAEAELEIIGLIQRRLEAGIDTPHWAETKLADLARLRAEIEAELTRVADASYHQLALAFEEAYETGVNGALADLSGAGVEGAFGRTNVQLVQAFIDEAALGLQSQHLGILRQSLDGYREAVAEALRQAAVGAETRRQASQRVMDELGKRGIAAFTDSAGRVWEPATYAEMTARTGLGRSAVEGHLRTLQENGRDLVIVSDSPEECPVCRPWEGRVLSISGNTRGTFGTGDGGEISVSGTVREATSAGLFHPNCVAGDTLVSGPAKVAAFRRWYEGEVIILRTAGGYALTVTPNHPVLTAKGWIAAGSLNEGDQVIRYVAGERMVETVNPDDVDVPARIEDVFSALRKSSQVPTVVVPVSAEDFHGDGLSSEVDIVWADSELRHVHDAGVVEPSANDDLGFTVGGPAFLSGSGSLGEFIPAGPATFGSPVSVAGEGFPASGGEPFNPAGCGLATADAGSRFEDVFADSGLADAEDARQLILSLAGLITFDKIVNLNRSEGWSGHVYNLQTTDGWYASNSIITHNCTHRLGLFTPGLTKRMRDTATRQDRYEERQEQRRLERGIRQWKRREQAAMTPEAKEYAKRHRQAWQGRMREFTEETDRRRQYAREQIGQAI